MNSVCVLTILTGLITVAVPSFAGVAPIEGMSSNPDDAIFYFYEEPTRKQEIVYDNVGSLAPLKKQATTVFIIGGFLTNGSSESPQAIKNGFLSINRLQNVIVLDWGKLSGSLVNLAMHASSAYQIAMENIDILGERVADFINFLHTHADIPPNKVEIVGHSLGAHMAGAVGFFLNKKYKKSISRITGLDPAGPSFSKQKNFEKRLDKTDADFVAIYHSNKGTLGDTAPKTGHINVFVNGGSKQPGCDKTDNSAGCSHSFAWKLFKACFTETITACPCKGSQCQCKDCNMTCTDPITLGYATSPSANGDYYVKTGVLK